MQCFLCVKNAYVCGRHNMHAVYDNNASGRSAMLTVGASAGQLAGTLAHLECQIPLP